MRGTDSERQQRQHQLISVDGVLVDYDDFVFAHNQHMTTGDLHSLQAVLEGRKEKAWIGGELGMPLYYIEGVRRDDDD